MARQMEIWNWTGRNQLAPATVPMPEPGPHEVLLRVRAVGICGTDLHIVQGVINFVPPPIPLGHEVAAEVVACGPGVTQVKVGDRCALDPMIGCGHCQWCRLGQTQHCVSGREIGITAPGAWQQYMVVPENNCYPFPDHVSFAEASQAETLHVVLGGVDRLQVKPGQSALVIGDGPTGLFFAQLLRAAGCVPVVLAGARQRRLELALGWGIHRVVNVAQTPLEQALGNERFAVVVEAVGLAQTIQQAVAMAAPQGKVLLFGLPGDAAVPIGVTSLLFREITILAGTNAPGVWPRVIKLIADGTVRVKEMLTHFFPFAHLPAAVAWAADHAEETVKVVVEYPDAGDAA